MPPGLTPVVLGGLALLLAGPVPALLERATWPYLVPRAAIVLWQALALAAVLAALGAGLALALSFVLDPDAAPLLLGIQLAALVLTLLVTGRLAWIAVRVAVGTRSRRRRHRTLVDLLEDPHGLGPGLRVIAEHTPVVYCVPGVRDARVVVSSGALDRLGAEELAAVLAHERAHLRARHDLVLEAFVALREAFPQVLRGGVGDVPMTGGVARGAGHLGPLPSVAHAPLTQCRLLLELLADDVGVRKVGAGPLARALVALSTTPSTTPSTSPERPCHADDSERHGVLTTTAGAARTTDTVRRVRRLGGPARPYPLLSTVTYLAAAALVLVPTFTVAVPWLSRVLGTLG